MIEGIILPVVTPFHEDGSIDVEAQFPMVDAAIKSGVDALFILGSAGMGPAMSQEERVRMADLVIKHVKGRLPTVVHVGTTHLSSTIELAIEAKKSGATDIAVIPPYYYSDHPWAEIAAHFRGVAKACNLPLMMYNNARYSGIHVTAEQLAGLADELPSISGVKLSYMSQSQIMGFVNRLPERVAVYPATVPELLPTVPFGVKGTINPPSVLFADLSVALWRAIKSENWTLAFQLQKRLLAFTGPFARLEAKHGRFIVGEGLRMMGFKVTKYPRWEQGTPIDAEARKTLQAMLDVTTIKHDAQGRVVA